MQQQTSISLEGLGTLWAVLPPEKRSALQAELQGVVDKWHRTEMQTILNAAMFDVQRQQAMKNQESEASHEQ